MILNHHYGFDENISFDYWTLPEKAAYWNAIANYNVVAIFTGHDHQSSLSDDWIHPFLPPGLVASGPNLPVARPDGRTCLPTFNGAALLAQAFLDVEIVGDTMTVTRQAPNGSTSSVSFVMGSADVPYSATQTLNCPEPGQVAMLLPGLGMLGWLGRRKASRLSVAKIRPDGSGAGLPA